MSRRRKRRTGKRQDDARAVQAELYDAATTWHEGVDMMLGEIDIGPCLDYPVMQALVGIKLHQGTQAGEGGAGDGK